MKTKSNRVVVEITLDKPWISPNKWDRLKREPAAKWAAQKEYKRKWQVQILQQWETFELPPLDNVSIDAFRIAKGSFDDDNLKGGLKAIIDCLKVRSKSNPHGCDVILEDRKSVMKKLTTLEMKPEAGEQERTVLMITGTPIDRDIWDEKTADMVARGQL